MKRQFALAWLGAALALVPPLGCGGDGGDASVSGVIPGELFVGRDARLLVVGSGTDWDDGVTVDLGEGVTVRGVSAASPTALLVDVTASPSAAIGPRDVAVGGLDFAAGLELVPPIQVRTAGTTAQGSISVLRVQNVDFDHPFDTTSAGGGLEPPTFPNVLASAGEGTTTQVSKVQPYSMELVVLSDVRAPTGTRALDIQSGPPGEQVGFTLPAAFELVERAPIPLGSGQRVRGSIGQPFDSALYSVTPDDLSVVRVSTFAQSASAAPAVAVLPASGEFADLVSFNVGTTLVTEETHYLVYWDRSGMSGYQFELAADASAVAQRLSEVEPNDLRADAVVVEETPAIVVDSSIPTRDDQDWIEVSLAAEDVVDGANLRVITYGDDPLTDTAVAIFSGTAADPIASSDVVRLDEVTASIEEPGTYYVRISASSDASYDPSHSQYRAAILVE